MYDGAISRHYTDGTICGLSLDDPTCEHKEHTFPLRCDICTHENGDHWTTNDGRYSGCAECNDCEGFAAESVPYSNDFQGLPEDETDGLCLTCYRENISTSTQRVYFNGTTWECAAHRPEDEVDDESEDEDLDYPLSWPPRG